MPSTPDRSNSRSAGTKFGISPRRACLTFIVLFAVNYLAMDAIFSDDEEAPTVPYAASERGGAVAAPGPTGETL